MLHPSTQHKLCILQGLVVEQPVQFCPLCRGVTVLFLLNGDTVDGEDGAIHESGFYRLVSILKRQESSLFMVSLIFLSNGVYSDVLNPAKSKDFMAFLFCKPWLHGFCTVFARSVLSMSDDVGRCIALQSVPFFASGEQGQAQLCLHFRVGILEQFQESRHGGGRFACGGYSLRVGAFGLGIEAAFKLLAQLHTGGLLDKAGKDFLEDVLRFFSVKM